MRNLWYYAFASWRAAPSFAEGSIPFSYHEKSGHAGLMFGVLLACAVEGIVLHLFLRHRAPWIAWALTLSTVHWLMLSEPVSVQLPYGLKKQVQAVGIEPDEAKKFLAAIDAH